MSNAKTQHVPFLMRAPNPIIKSLLRLGIPIGPMILLTVRGRKTGQPRTTPVGLFELDGRRYLFSTFGESNWVRNIRAAGEAILSCGRHREKIAVVELTPVEAAPVLKDAFVPYLASPFGRMMLSSRYHVTSDTTLSEFITVAQRHPVFKLR